MIHSAKNTEEDLDNNDQHEDIKKSNVCKKKSKACNLTRHVINVHEKKERKRKYKNTQKTNKPLQFEKYQKTFKTKFNQKRQKQTHV